MASESNNDNQDGALLTHEQWHYLQTIFDYLHEKAEWPKRRYLERRLVNEDLDAREIAKSLAVRMGYSPYAESWDPDREATLSIPDMMLCQGSQVELDAFAQSLRLCIQAYLSHSDSEPIITSLDLITRLHMPEWIHTTAGRQSWRGKSRLPV